jgi:hypothetical protein
MNATKGITLGAAMMALALSLGCGDSGSSGGSSSTPPAQSVSAAQKGSAASNTGTKTVEEATNALLNAGTNGATATTQTASGGAQSPSPTFNFQATVSVVVDFDVLDGEGQDAFPNVSGQLQVDATGSVTGDPSGGTANYSVETEWLTDGVFTDPACGTQATIASGSGLSYTLVVEWTYTDSLHWSVQATSDFSANRTVTVTQSGGTWTATGTVERHATASISRSGDTWTVSLGVSGQRTLIVTNGIETHTVVIDVQAIDRIFITVDGVTFGPYTAGQIWAWWHFHCEL